VKNRLLLAVTAVTLLSPVARGVMLDTSGTGAPPPPPPPPVVTCTLTQNDITVTSFADIIGYKISGPCKVTFPGTSMKPVSSTYEGGGSWNSTNGMVNEYLKGRDAKNQIWDIQGGGTCKLDPWMTGPAAASCSTTIGNSTPNAPAIFLKSLKVPISAGVLDQQARGWLTGKTLHAIGAEHQAPVITKPTEGQHATFPLALAISAGPDSPTNNFALEWQAKVNGVWTAKDVTDQVGSTASFPSTKFGDLADWRVRARAHQTTKATWSSWRTFTLPILGPPAMATPCGNAAAYGAKYDVSAMPSTMAAGSSTSVSIKVTNGSNQTWALGSNYHLSYHWAGGPVPQFEGERTFLPSGVPPCGSVVFSAKVVAPSAAGAYQIQWDMVLEGVAWFSNQGVLTGNKSVTVTP
jgi:hypothetical protein